MSSESSKQSRIARKSGTSCSYCGKTPEDFKILLPQCSKCNNVSYCNVECQKLHWKEHKPMCKMHNQLKNSVVDALGENFFSFTKRWNEYMYVPLTSLANIHVTADRAHSHTFLVRCDYNESVGRAKKALIQLDSYQAIPNAEMSKILLGNAPAVEAHYAAKEVNERSDALDNYFFRVVVFIYNNTEGVVDKKPMILVRTLTHITILLNIILAVKYNAIVCNGLEPVAHLFYSSSNLDCIVYHICMCICLQPNYYGMSKSIEGPSLAPEETLVTFINAG